MPIWRVRTYAGERREHVGDQTEYTCDWTEHGGDRIEPDRKRNAKQDWTEYGSDKHNTTVT